MDVVEVLKELIVGKLSCFWHYYTLQCTDGGGDVQYMKYHTDD